MKVGYLIGSLRNTFVPQISKELRTTGVEIFDNWISVGPQADDFWKEYEQSKGLSYLEALDGYSAKHVYNFDKYHLDRSDFGVLVCPSGKSCHLELGYLIGQGKPGYILLDTEDIRWDVMYQFATCVFDKLSDLKEAIINDL